MHWKSEPKYAQHGVNGSICSILVYLSEVFRLHVICEGRDGVGGGSSLTWHYNGDIPLDTGLGFCDSVYRFTFYLFRNHLKLNITEMS